MPIRISSNQMGMFINGHSLSADRKACDFNVKIKKINT